MPRSGSRRAPASSPSKRLGTTSCRSSRRASRYAGSDFDAAETEQPAGLATVYGVDSDDGFAIVRPEDVERWGKTVEEIDEIALDNLLRQTNEEQPLLCEPSGNQELCGWASEDGYDATRMIVPELRRQIREQYGNDEPVAYAVPEEHIYVALPLNTLRRGESNGRSASSCSATSRCPRIRSAPRSSSRRTASSSC